MQYDDIVAEIQNGLKRLDGLGLEILAIKTGFMQCSKLIEFKSQIDEAKNNLLETDTKQVSVPCFIGDTVYHIGRRDKKVHASLVRKIEITTKGRIYIRLKCGKKGVVGNDIFLTERQAEENRQSQQITDLQGGK